MSRVFNGVQNARLGIDGDIDGLLGLGSYPVVMAVWLKPANLAQDSTFIGVQTSPSGANGVQAQLRGSEADDPLRIYMQDTSGVASILHSTTGKMFTTAWTLAVMKLTSTSSRQIGTVDYNGSQVDWGTANTDSRTLDWTLMDRFNIGVNYRSIYKELFAGKIGQTAIWVGTVPSDANLISMAGQADWTGIAAGGLQELWTMDAVGDEVGVISGVSLTSVNVSTDSNDNPHSVPDVFTGAASVFEQPLFILPA